MNRTDSPFECLAELDQETINRLAGLHLERLRELNATADRIVDKMPDNFLYLGFLAALFPQARFIHCCRDLRDIALSCWMTNFGQLHWAFDMDHIALRIRQYERLMEHWRRVLPVQIYEVRYEDMIADLEGVSRRLLSWCGLEWEPGCLEFHKTRRPVRTASVNQVRRPLYSTSAGRWKNYEHHLPDLLGKLAV
jgi:hypothetical protein